VSKKTVSNYLATQLPLPQSHYPCGLNVPRKEDGGV
jgi:hypothetical protein